jgi:hypothetical protein
MGHVRLKRATSQSLRTGLRFSESARRALCSSHYRIPALHTRVSCLEMCAGSETSEDGLPSTRAWAVSDAELLTQLHDPALHTRVGCLLPHPIRPPQIPHSTMLPRQAVPRGQALGIELGGDALKAQPLLAERHDAGDGRVRIIGGRAACLGAGGADGRRCLSWWGRAGHVEQAVIALLHLLHHPQQVRFPFAGGLGALPCFLQFVPQHLDCSRRMSTTTSTDVCARSLRVSTTAATRTSSA